MENKKRKNSWVDGVALVTAIILGQVTCERLPIDHEMARFLVSALVAGVLLTAFYVLRYWLHDRH